MTTGELDSEERVLFLPPTRRDRDVTCDLLSKSGMQPFPCTDMIHLAEEVRRGAGAVLLTEKVLTQLGINAFLTTLKQQQTWSDLPVVLMLYQGTPSPAANKFVGQLTNVTLIELPASTSTVVSSVQAALRARRRQYQIQQLLESEQAARREGERANLIKDEFLATLSHELRTPLNAIFGWTQLLKMKPNDANQVREAVTVIDRNVRMQTQLIEDLLDMSRIISGKINLDIMPVDMGNVIDAAIDAVLPAAKAKKIRLQRVVEVPLPIVYGDFNRLQQVIWNLVTNAVKFTSIDGVVHLRCQQVDSCVEVSVTDTGEGIEPEFLPHLFERFSQADGSTTRRHGGLGLGLSIVKNLVELHGGTIHAASPGLGAGSTFLVRLPASSSSPLDERQSVAGCETPLTRADGEGLSGLKILVVDDEFDARELMRRLLSERGAIMLTSGSAEEARLQLATFRPELIISDIGMPHRDGYEFIKALRNDGITTPAIALTAFARVEDRIRSIAAGFQAHLAKPVEPAELLATILRLISPSQIAQS
ncbi:ATP-binding protein [Schlesneria sp. DSM 10557]|uniref:ATP-binding response regulator n=1 Tax=Schlesneria sp. DSM 10557 TaxID=3044399 RepID=UPI0035A154E1